MKLGIVGLPNVGLRHGRCELFEVFALQTLDLRPA